MKKTLMILGLILLTAILSCEKEDQCYICTAKSRGYFSSVINTYCGDIELIREIERTAPSDGFENYECKLKEE